MGWRGCGTLYPAKRTEGFARSWLGWKALLRDEGKVEREGYVLPEHVPECVILLVDFDGRCVRDLRVLKDLEPNIAP